MGSRKSLLLAVVPWFAVAAVALLLAAAGQAASTNFDPAPGSYTVNTTTLRLTGPGTNISGSDVNGVAVFSFDDVTIQHGVTITASGSRPLEFAASGTFTLAGTIDGSGTSATADFVAGPYAGGPGGGAGGTDGTANGTGPGGGAHGTTTSDGGGGGGFGGAGATGGSDGGAGGAGGSAYGDLNTALQGGSGGAGGTTDDGGVGGGGGGGGIELSGSSLTISATGAVLANGGNGDVGGEGGSGGGSGGGILLHANTIDVTGMISAAGGQGGAGGCCGDGGGGGGGRVAYQYVTAPIAAGTPNVTGGTSGTSGEFPHGYPSPQATGAAGVVTKAQAASAKTTAATSVKSTSATLTGTVNPNGNPATYQFQYGTSTAYGKTVPASPASAGSGSTAQMESQAVSGLAPGKTYHYRIVAYSLGFTITGADMTFKTKAPPKAKTGSASSVGTSSAKISGSVNPEGGPTTYYFQYYASAHSIHHTATKNAGSGKSRVKVSANLSGLAAATKYHYRLVAKNAGGSTRGHWLTFTTKAPPPHFTG